jgi:hypothetical protein
MHSNQPTRFDNVKCFGSNAALTIEATFNKNVPTLNIEMAQKKGEHFDWANKLVLQLSDTELPMLCSMLLGYSKNISIKRNTKGLEAERQANKIFLKGTSSGNIFTLPLAPGDVFRVSAFALKQLKCQSGLESETMILAAIRGCSTLIKL